MIACTFLVPARRTALAAALAAAACQPLPHPFAADAPRPGSPILTLRDSASVTIAPVQGTPRATAEKLGLPIRARLAHFAVGAEDPAIVLSAPNPVTRKLLARSGMSIDDFDAMECNEAFAAIALMWAREFLPDRERYNPRGGAIAIGHPLGASGVRITTTLLNQLETTGGRYGFQTMCEGGGQANATVIERLA